MTTPARHVLHPPLLEETDRRYLVPWGRVEMLRSSLGCVAAVAVSAGLGVFVSAWCYALLGVVLGGWAFLVLFFRNPRRRVPEEPGILVAPADGTVWDVEEAEEGEFLGCRALRIGIFLSVLDVHVNRAPADAIVEWTRHRSGEFHDARRPQAARENESNSVALRALWDGRPEGVPLLVRQVSGAIARRIVCPLQPGDRVRRGGLIGMIKYGSRTELWVPLGLGFRALVKAGDKVVGGETVIGRLEPVGAASEGAAHRRVEVDTAAAATRNER
jgi:phosphatidylserine decarboxylase